MLKLARVFDCVRLWIFVLDSSTDVRFSDILVSEKANQSI